MSSSNFFFPPSFFLCTRSRFSWQHLLFFIRACVCVRSQIFIGKDELQCFDANNNLSLWLLECRIIKIGRGLDVKRICFLLMNYVNVTCYWFLVITIRLTLFQRAFWASARNFAYSWRSYKKSNNLHTSSITNPMPRTAPIMKKAMLVSGSVVQITMS